MQAIDSKVQALAMQVGEMHQAQLGQIDFNVKLEELRELVTERGQSQAALSDRVMEQVKGDLMRTVSGDVDGLINRKVSKVERDVETLQTTLRKHTSEGRDWQS